MEKGKLFLVATPIGNLKDITLRALETLREADVIAAEDTRHTIKLLNHYEIKGKLMSFHEYSRESRFEGLLGILRDGKKVALVSDAGTPVVSDPGFALVARCAQEGICVESIPGACAAVTAVTLCAMDCSHFIFWGFLSQKQNARRNELERIAQMRMPCVVYESPNRVVKMLEDVCAVCGEDTPVCICRELTKLHEEVLRGTAKQALESFAGRDAVKGEFAVVFYPQEQAQITDEADITDALKLCLEKGMTKKSAVSQVAKQSGIPKNRVYQIMLQLEK